MRRERPAASKTLSRGAFNKTYNKVVYNTVWPEGVPLLLDVPMLSLERSTGPRCNCAYFDPYSLIAMRDLQYKLPHRPENERSDCFKSSKSV